MVLKAAFFLSVGTAFGMYLAQEYDGMPNVKAFTTGLVSDFEHIVRLSPVHSSNYTFTLQVYQAKEIEKDLRKDKGRGD